MISKRSRSTNWEPVEKELLRELVSQSIGVLENKSTDTNTNLKKKKAWIEIHKRFNDLNSKLRELNHVQQQWRTMKLEAKRGISQYKSSMKKTGGGEKPPSPKADHVVILELLPQEFEEGSNFYDCDARKDSVQETACNTRIPVEVEIHERPLTPVLSAPSCSFDIIEEVETYSNLHQREISTKKSSLNLTRKDKKIPKDNKQQIIKIIEEHKKEIHVMKKQKTELKMKLLSEKHDAIMKKIHLETKLLLEENIRKCQKHDLEMEILKKQLKDISD